MLKLLATTAILLAGTVMTGNPAHALQTVVTQIDKNADGSATYHFAVKLMPGETLTPAAGKVAGDFVTVYNFYGLVDGSAKSPAGWEFSSEEFGRTPILDGYPLVLPVDVPNTPNLTWAVTKAVTAGGQIDGFTATTHVQTVVQGEYSAQISQQVPAIQGAPAGVLTGITKQAMIGAIPTPSFLAETK